MDTSVISIEDEDEVAGTVSQVGAAIMPLPPNSSDYNPMERVFDYIRDWMNTNNAYVGGVCAEQALIDAFGSLSPAACQRFIREIPCYRG